MASITFKRKTKRSASGRKRVHDDDDAERQNHEDLDETVQSIEELLEDQKLRAQLLRSEQLATSKQARVSAASSAPSTTEAQYGLHDPKKDGSAGQKLLNLLDGQFTGQSGVTQRDQYEELATKYIEERLQKRVKQDPDDSHETSQVVSTDDQIYEELKHQVSGSVGPDESTNGGVLIWNTGIAEVELPSTYVERTVRDTRLALERADTTAANRSVSSALPANFSTDFNRHRTDYVQDLKSMSREEQRDRGFVVAKRDKPSDDQAVARFRKMESRRRHNH